MSDEVMQAVIRKRHHCGTQAEEALPKKSLLDSRGLPSLTSCGPNILAPITSRPRSSEATSVNTAVRSESDAPPTTLTTSSTKPAYAERG